MATLLQDAHGALMQGEDTLAQGYNALSTTAQNVWNAARGAMDDAWRTFNGAIAQVKDFANNAYAYTADAIHSFWSGVNNMFQSVIDNVKAALAGVLREFEKNLLILGVAAVGALYLWRHV